jgi:hypothetical protein
MDRLRPAILRDLPLRSPRQMTLDDVRRLVDKHLPAEYRAKFLGESTRKQRLSAVLATRANASAARQCAALFPD